MADESIWNMCGIIHYADSSENEYGIIIEIFSSEKKNEIEVHTYPVEKKILHNSHLQTSKWKENLIQAIPKDCKIIVNGSTSSSSSSSPKVICGVISEYTKKDDVFVILGGCLH